MKVCVYPWYWSWLNTDGQEASFWHACKEIAYTRLGGIGAMNNQFNGYANREANGAIDIKNVTLLISTNNEEPVQNKIRHGVNLLNDMRYASATFHDGVALVSLDRWFVHSSVHTSFTLTALRLAREAGAEDCSSLGNLLSTISTGQDASHIKMAKDKGTINGLFSDTLKVCKYGWRTASRHGNWDAPVFWGVASYNDADAHDAPVTDEQLAHRKMKIDPIERSLWCDRTMIRESKFSCTPLSKT